MPRCTVLVKSSVVELSRELLTQDNQSFPVTHGKLQLVPELGVIQGGHSECRKVRGLLASDPTDCLSLRVDHQRIPAGVDVMELERFGVYCLASIASVVKKRGQFYT